MDRIVQAVCELFPDVRARENVRVLVPECGLGLQVYEFVSKGFWTQGNEVSYHMLMALRFVLNITRVEGYQCTDVVNRADIKVQVATSVPVIMEGMQLTRERLFDLMRAMGFEILQHESGIQCLCSSDYAALSKYVYGCDFWVARVDGRTEDA
ncbi:hypothetical protein METBISCDRAFT_27562 [Metschnikowia bicuspidata]|uniref:Uncharacterized protein n=1 Tax=Metschnikowia bicuspidata TaxID=27322 RepID=A0A4P9ZBN6_9ASCO|nr:hypothetical protein METBISCDRAFT_27562 [Metschnikowia bicuspidata]